MGGVAYAWAGLSRAYNSGVRTQRRADAAGHRCTPLPSETRRRGQRAMRAAANEPTSSFKLHWIKSCEARRGLETGRLRMRGAG